MSSTDAPWPTNHWARKAISYPLCFLIGIAFTKGWHWRPFHNQLDALVPVASAGGAMWLVLTLGQWAKKDTRRGRN